MLSHPVLPVLNGYANSARQLSFEQGGIAAEGDMLSYHRKTLKALQKNRASQYARIVDNKAFLD
jgi:hypothetical protein